MQAQQLDQIMGDLAERKMTLPEPIKKAKRRKPVLARLRCPGGCGHVFHIGEKDFPDTLIERHTAGECTHPDPVIVQRLADRATARGQSYSKIQSERSRPDPKNRSVKRRTPSMAGGRR